MPASASQEPEAASPSKLGFWSFLFGVFLPMSALMFEVQTHYCAKTFFDPFPSEINVALFALIPLTNFLIMLAEEKDSTSHFAFLIFGNGTAFGIGILYTLMLIPVMAASLPAVFFWGVGLLAFAPLLSLIPTWMAGETICKLAEKHGTFFHPKQLEHFGHALVLLTVICSELPSTFTRMAMHEASEPQTAKQGLQKLRQFGNRDVMLRACYEHSGRATDIIGTLYESAKPMPTSTARNLFYKVTGMPFNSVPIPQSARATMAHADVKANIFNVNVDDEFDYDPDVAGETVSGIARGLTAVESSMNTVIHPAEEFAHLDWQLTFSNSSKFEREVRARILLPHSAVVTHASVIIDGKEREATITERSTARSMYTSNAAARKDPLLVSTTGIDRVLMQCYPVRPDQKVTAKLTIISPLDHTQNGKGALALPQIEERNFQFAEGMSNSIVAKSTTDITCPVMKRSAVEVSQSQGETLQGEVAPAEMSKLSPVIAVELPSQEGPIPGHLYKLTSFHQMPPSPDVRIIVDGSKSMQPYLKEISEAIRDLPSVQLFFISDEEVLLEGSGADVAARLEKLECAGGQDNEGILMRLGTSLTNELQTVVWIHGPQPAPSSNMNYALQQMGNAFTTRRASRQLPALYDMQVANGACSTLDSAPHGVSIERVPHIGSVKDDLVNLFASWKADQLQSPMAKLFRIDESTAPAEQVQLRAYHNCMQLLQMGPGTEHRAYEIASRYHLVTPVSSAVVLPVEQAEEIERERKMEDARRLAEQHLVEKQLVEKKYAERQLAEGRLLALQSGDKAPRSSGGADGFESRLRHKVSLNDLDQGKTKGFAFDDNERQPQRQALNEAVNGTLALSGTPSSEMYQAKDEKSRGDLSRFKSFDSAQMRAAAPAASPEPALKMPDLSFGLRGALQNTLSQSFSETVSQLNSLNSYSAASPSPGCSITSTPGCNYPAYSYSPQPQASSSDLPSFISSLVAGDSLGMWQRLLMLLWIWCLLAAGLIIWRSKAQFK